MQPARIAELLAPFLGDAHQLASDDLGHISTYIDILLRWNARINLTAVRDPDEIVTRHFGESFFAARVLFPERNQVGTAVLESLGGRVTDAKTTAALAPQFSTSVPVVSPVLNKITLADVGSGAGFPGIPLKLWHPSLALMLVESNQKKATFLREVARSLTLTETNILMARAETLSKTSFDVVTLRAVERFESILAIASRLVSAGGRLALLIGSAQISLAESVLGQIHGFAADQFVAESVPLSRARVVVVAKRGESTRP